MPVLLLLFFLSGFASLVLEGVLLRELTWLVGSAVVATTLVLAAFLAGLALGALTFGAVADRYARPLRLYGFLEVGAGVSGAVAVWVLGSGREMLVPLLRIAGGGAADRAAACGVALLVLIVPTSFMGGTLPALTRLAVRDPSRIHGPLGSLYGVNTLGGSVGAFATGFFLFESLGISASGYAGALVAVAVGLTALAVDRAGHGAVASPGPGARPEGERSGVPRQRAACLAAIGIGGAAVLGAEVVWTRLLSLPMRSYAYSFSLMLALFLLGLVLGAFVVSLLADRVRAPVRLLGWVEVGIALYVASSVVWLPTLLGPPERAGSFSEFLARGALRAAVVVLPPTLLSGMALPLAARALSPSSSRLGRDVGALYAVNTLGSITGALLAGLVLLPSLGASGSLAVLALLNAIAGTLVMTTDRSALRKVLAAASALACVGALLAPGAPFRQAFLRASVGGARIGDVLLFREGATDTIAIVRKDYGFHDESAKSLITNGVSMSATVKPVWRYMAMEGHLPVLLAKDPSRALVICLGTGITLGAVASHPELASIDAVELSAGVLEGLPLFRAENAEAFLDPRVRVIREDGRHFLELSHERYDVITVEPPPPIVAGAAHLYSLDFYELCKRRLSPGGVVAQWLPLHAQSLASARMTARTFLDAFPHAQLWLPSVRDAILVGSETPLTLELGRLRAAFATPETRANLERAMVESPEAFLGTFLLDRDGIARWAGAVPPITDEHPRMEFFRSSGPNMAEREIATLLAHVNGARPFVLGLDAEPDTAERVEVEGRALQLYVRSEAEGEPRLGVEAARISSGTEFFLYPLGCAQAQLRALGRLPGQAEVFRRQAARCSSIASRSVP